MGTPVSAGQGSSYGGTVAQRVLAVLQEVLALKAPPRLEACLRGELLVSSMDAMALVLTLEDEFGASIDEGEMEPVETVADLVALIEARLPG